MSTWRDTAFTIEVRGTLKTGGVWDTGLWDTATWVDTADDDEYNWTDITDDYVTAKFSSAKRARLASPFTPGTATVTVRNVDGDYTLAKPGATISVGLPLRIVASFGGLEYVKFRGVITAAPTIDTPGKVQLARITAKAPLARIARPNRVGYSSPVGAGELPGVRVARILDSVVWPTSLRDIDTGVETLQGTLLAGSAFDELNVVALSEGGEIFHDDNGSIVFYDRAAVAALSSASPAFTVAGYADPGSAGIWIPYATLASSEGVDDVRNHVTIGRVDGTPQTAYDTASIEQHGLATVNRLDLVTEDDTYPATLAAAIVAARKDPVEKYPSILLTAGDAAAVDAVLDAQILDATRVRRYAGATEIDETALIESMKHTIRPALNDGAGTRTDTWTVTLATGPAI